MLTESIVSCERALVIPSARGLRAAQPRSALRDAQLKGRADAAGSSRASACEPTEGPAAQGHARGRGYYHVPARAGGREGRGISFHSWPSSIRPPAFGVRPPHCLKKKGILAAAH